MVLPFRRLDEPFFPGSFTRLTTERPGHSCGATPIHWLELVLAEPPREYRQEKYKMTGVSNKLQTRDSPLMGFRSRRLLCVGIMRWMQRKSLLSCLENRAWTSEVRSYLGPCWQCAGRIGAYTLVVQKIERGLQAWTSEVGLLRPWLFEIFNRRGRRGIRSRVRHCSHQASLWCSVSPPAKPRLLRFRGAFCGGWLSKAAACCFGRQCPPTHRRQIDGPLHLGCT
jgi:hypothetical protein